MQKRQNEGTPNTLFIENPFTEKSVNILPLLQFSFNELSGFNSGESSVLQVIDEAIRAISTKVDYDVFSEKYQLLLYKLYGLRDALKDSIEIPKTGGQNG